MAEEKKRNWFLRHWFISIILIIIILALIGSITSSPKTNSDGTKTYSSPLAECNALCEQVYSAQGQIDVCQSTCQNTDYLGGENKTLSVIKTLKAKLNSSA